jgi:hypothetical protein
LHSLKVVAVGAQAVVQPAVRLVPVVLQALQAAQQEQVQRPQRQALRAPPERMSAEE